MPKLRVHCFTLSLDGYGAGPRQNLEHPLGVGGEALHGWMVPTRTFQQKVLGNSNGESGVDDDFTARGFAHVGAWILGRNMFGPIRGDWPDHAWKGWWGDNPPYHTPVFVLTHHERPSLHMEGGTTFHFVTDGIHAALQRATWTCAWVVAWPPSGNTCEPGSSMRCTSPSAPCCWAAENTCSAAWTGWRWGTDAASTWPPPMRCIAPSRDARRDAGCHLRQHTATEAAFLIQSPRSLS